MQINTIEKSQLLHFLHIAGLRLTQQMQQATVTSSHVAGELEQLNKIYTAVSNSVPSDTINTNPVNQINLI